MNLHDIESRERDIAARHGIAMDRIDRVWLRQAAIKSLSRDGESELASATERLLGRVER